MARSSTTTTKQKKNDGRPAAGFQTRDGDVAQTVVDLKQLLKECEGLLATLKQKRVKQIKIQAAGNKNKGLKAIERWLRNAEKSLDAVGSKVVVEDDAAA